VSESKVNRENYITIQGWMITDLGLKGNELIIYALIYGFSQAESQVFGGSLKYLADWTNSTKQGVLKALQSLIDKGYITKDERNINGVKFYEYHSTKFNTLLNKVEYPIKQSLTGGIQQSLPNNININKLNNNIDNNTYVKIVDLYHRICVSLPKVKKLTDGRKKVIRARLNQFSLEHIEEVFAIAESSDFLKGANGKWNASFDWLMNESNFVKVLEGNYNNKIPNTPVQQKETEYDRFMSGLSKFVEENEK
jgi:predicted transcriptional regulator